MTAKTRVGIIGTGSVGASVAISTLAAGVAQELWLHDLRPERAEGEALDLAHGAALYPAATVRTASLAEMAGTDAMVIAAGRGGHPDESRLDLLRDNAAVTREIGRTLRGYGGIALMVANPVDVLTYVLAESSGLPPERVLGTGTMLDTARLRQALGQELGLDPRSVHAQVVGEHGDSEVVLWSSAQVGGTPLRSWPDWTAEKEGRIADEVRTAAYRIIQRKGFTNHAIGLVAARLLVCVLRDERRVLTVSRVQEGAAGLRDVALSLPTVIGLEGGASVVAPPMTAEEQGGLEHSAAVLRRAIEAVSA